MSLSADSTIEEQIGHVLLYTAKEKSEKLYDGDNYIDSKNYTLLVLVPNCAKKPK